MDKDESLGQDDTSGNDETAAAAAAAAEAAKADGDKGGDQSADKGAEAAADKGGKGGDDWLPADWRDRFANGLPEDQRGKAKDYLKNRSSPFDILRSGMAADSKISELTRDRVRVPTGKNDDPKDVAAYRKARGTPEKAENYDIRLPEDFGEMDQLDSEMSDEFKKKAHSLNWGQKDFDLAIDTVIARDKMRAAEQANRVLRAKEAAQDELRIEFGKEYRGNVELINRFIGEEMKRVGVDDANLRREALSERFADGMALGEKPWFVKMMANIARRYADDGLIETGETEEAGDVDTRIDKIVGLMHSDPKEYERMQPELQKLIAVQNRRGARKGGA